MFWPRLGKTLLTNYPELKYHERRRSWISRTLFEYIPRNLGGNLKNRANVVHSTSTALLPQLCCQVTLVFFLIVFLGRLMLKNRALTTSPPISSGSREIQKERVRRNNHCIQQSSSSPVLANMIELRQSLRAPLVTCQATYNLQNLTLYL